MIGPTRVKSELQFCRSTEMELFPVLFEFFS